jgi:hypothetical protein
MDDNQVPGPPPSEMPMYEKTLAEISPAGTLGISAIAHRPTITEVLQYRKANLLKELEQIDHALKVAEEQKGAMDLIDSIAKTGVSSRL